MLRGILRQRIDAWEKVATHEEKENHAMAQHRRDEITAAEEVVAWLDERICEEEKEGAPHPRGLGRSPR
jgi:hypothetical protein